MLHVHSKKAIVDTIQSLVNHSKINGAVKVVASADKSHIDISFDNRKYIGRVRLELQGSKYLVYLMDKAIGKIATSDVHASKSAYMEIKSKAEANQFVKWYILLTELAALKRRARTPAQRAQEHAVMEKVLKEKATKPNTPAVV